MNLFKVLYYNLRYQMMSPERRREGAEGLAEYHAIRDAFDSYTPGFRSLLIIEALGVEKKSADYMATMPWVQFKAEGQARLMPIVRRVMEGVPYTGESKDDLILASESYDEYGESVAWSTLPTYVKRRLLARHFGLSGFALERMADTAWIYLEQETQERLAPIIRDVLGR